MNFQKLISKAYPKRDPEAQKYDHGLVIIIGGSKIYSGSPALAGLAALRAGADLTQIVAPYRAANIVAEQSPDFITFPLEGDKFTLKHLNKLLSITRSGKEVSNGNLSVVIGGGVGRDEDTKELIREYLKSVEVPAVVDADGIYAFEKEGKGIINHQMVFTPHLYEFFVLTGERVNQIGLEEKKQKVTQQAANLGTNIALKGAVDIISNGGETVENDLGVPELTAGGCGDSLAGVIGALLARGVSSMEAASLGVYINTKAGELAADEKGESLIATDLIEKLPKVIN